MMEAISVFFLPLNFWKKYYPQIIYLILLGTVRFLCVIVLYVTVKILATNIELNQAINLSAILASVVCVLLIIIGRKEERKTAEQTGQNYINRIRSSLLKRMMRASIRDITQQPIGKVSSILGGDLNSLKRWITYGMSRLIVNVVVIFGLVGFLLTIDPIITVFLVTTMSILLAINIYLGSLLGGQLKQVRSQRVKLNGLVIERLKQIQTLRSSGQDIHEVNRVNKQAKTLSQELIPQGKLLGLIMGISEASGPLLAIVLLVSFRFTETSISLNQLAGLLSLIGFLATPVKEMSRVLNYYHGAKLSLTKIHKLFQYKRIVRGQSKSVTPQLLAAKVYVRGLGYDDCFSDLSFKLNSSDRMCVVGNNGTGKSTFMALLLGQLKPTQGSIKVNGVNPLYISAQDRARLFGVYRFGEGLMRGTIRDNITYRCPNASQAAVNQVIKQCNLSDEINAMVDGLDSVVNESGSNLSSGQIGRILLARAILEKPKLLLLDEPESSLDATGFRALKKLIMCYPYTIILITHNQAISSLCPKKINFNHHTIVKNKKSVRK